MPVGVGPSTHSGVTAQLVTLQGGTFIVGTDEPWIAEDGEGPARLVAIAPFAIAPCAVDIAGFARFVEATGHVTDAERIGWSFVFASEVDPGAHVLGPSGSAPWWLGVEGASWRRPGGIADALEGGAAAYPSVHVSWNDAEAYCAWSGHRLPTEAEWEYAAAAGVSGQPFPWGRELAPGGGHLCNTWQGTFPGHDTGEDGFRGRAPVDALPANGFGLHNMIGNVWEWCADPFAQGHAGCCVPAGDGGRRVQKGGSYLCHDSYCSRYRVQARIGSARDGSTGNVGFRVAADVAP